MTLKFTPIGDQTPGLIVSLLKESYAEILAADREHWEPEAVKWEQFDREVFDHLDTVGACVFLTWFEDQLIGFGSYDTRQKPEIGLVGHNCILPAFRGKGFGKAQIREMMQRFRTMGIQAAKTSNLAGPLHVPAQRMYTACGFQEVRRHPWVGDPEQTVIEYEMNLYA